MNGGIFTGNVLGSRGLGSVGLGAVAVPWWCWETPNFKAHNAQCSQYSGDEHAACLKTAVDNLCPWDSPPDKKTKALVASAMDKACNSSDVIKLVQHLTGNPNVDGRWGPQSQQYLDKSGRTFESFVTCTGPAPVHSGSGYQPVPTTTKTSTEVTIDPDKVAAEKQAGFSAMFSKVPTIAWVGVAGIAGLLLLKASKQKRGM